MSTTVHLKPVPTVEKVEDKNLRMILRALKENMKILEEVANLKNVLIDAGVINESGDSVYTPLAPSSPGPGFPPGTPVTSVGVTGTFYGTDSNGLMYQLDFTTGRLTVATRATP